MKSEMKMLRDRDREVKFLENSREILRNQTSSQAPSYARRLQSETMTHPPTDSLTGVKCRATSVAKKS